jgi:hypothetical protein
LLYWDAVPQVLKIKARPGGGERSGGGAEFSIEDVDEEKIDEILKDGTKNLVVFFCRCSCGLWRQ